MRIALIVSGFLLLAAVSAVGESYPGCLGGSQHNVPFTSEAATDILAVSIDGSPCYEATLEVSVTSEEGDQLYHYEARFKPHVVMHWENPELPEEANRLVRRFNNPISFSKANQLPKWLPKEDYYEANYQVLQVDRAYYDMLREQDWFVYTHLIHYEGWRVITYDRKKQKMVVISEGGL